MGDEKAQKNGTTNMRVTIEEQLKASGYFTERQAAAKALKNGDCSVMDKMRNKGKSIGDMSRDELEEMIAAAVEKALRKAL